MRDTTHLQLRRRRIVKNIGQKRILISLDNRVDQLVLVGLTTQRWVKRWVQVAIKVLIKVVLLHVSLVDPLIVLLAIHALLKTVIDMLIQVLVESVVDMLHVLTHVIQVILVKARHLAHVAHLPHVGHVVHVLHAIIHAWLLVGELLERFSAGLGELAVEILNRALEVVVSALRLVEVHTEVALRLATHLLTAAGIGLILLKLCDATAEELIDDLKFADAGLQGGVGSDELLEGLWHVEVAVDGGLGAAWGGWTSHVHATEVWGVELVVDEVIAIEGRHVVAVHVWSTGAGDWGAGAIRVAIASLLGWTTLLVHLVLLWGTMLAMLLLLSAEAIVLVEEALRKRGVSLRSWMRR